MGGQRTNTIFSGGHNRIRRPLLVVNRNTCANESLRRGDTRNTPYTLGGHRHGVDGGSRVDGCTLGGVRIGALLAIPVIQVPIHGRASERELLSQ